ncbi:MAG: pyruvate, phosphate dikinase [Bacteroidales bacterium]|nr:pyruvate, phosphate dikinase [Bacteroidales bacterium]
MAAKALLGGTEEKLPKSQPETKVYKPSGSRKKLLQRFLNKNNQDRDIYHDLMPFKVKEILLVANLYDAYSIEREGRFSEHVLGEYYQLNLTSVPRITGVSSPEEVFEQLGSKHFDMVILMMGADKKTPLDLSVEIKKAYPYIPTFLLLNNNGDIEYCRRKSKELNSIDKVFVWNGESQVFFAMIKHVEDKINVENDTRIGLVRVILLVEDSAKYYSRYLPMLYNIVMEQTRRIIDDVSTDELYKVLKLRARPKILLAETYEDAANIINKYKDYMLCLISDVKFEMNGQENTSAGYELIKFAKDQIADLPTILQSSEQENASLAHKLRSTFINKNSESLMMDFKSFITHFLGFGNFIYRDKQGNQISTARSLKEFEKRLKTIPDESLLYHARRDHFSLWLMARGEIQAAKILNPSKVTDFEKTEDLRKYLIEVIQKFRNEQNKGKIIPFEENAIEDESNVVSLSGGSLGGKGRGLAFINTLINNYDFGQHVPDIHIRAPKTSVIGTEEFEYFLERNHLRDTIYNETDYPTIKEIFLNSRLTDTLVRRLKIILKHIKKPIAVRSSGLFEDSLMQPFAGIFDTYLLPNSHPDTNVRLEQLKNAIKLVYASVFSETARGYISAVNYQIEEEKMAVVLQEVVGHEYDGYFYPHISGVAQSYNYYPFAHMKPEEGFAVAALGLGKYVVDGEKAYRFSPKYPNTDINTPKDQFKNSQVEFLAVDLNKSEPKLLEGDDAGLSRLDIDVAERHGTLRHLASVYDRENERIVPGLTHAGPRIINFANIFKYNYIPLAQTIEVVMDVVQEALGSPVEIEFAVDLKKDQNLKASFYLLQIKPLLGAKQGYEVNMKDYDKEQVMLYSEKVMGNGLIDDITDVVYVDPRDFDKAQTKQMAKEIDELNQHMRKEGQKYVLIGPGRWGTRDPWIGIPVNWPQISEAKVIVETSLEGYPLDASSGSHFFHNVTSMNVGYFSVQPEHSKSYINFDVLRQQQVVSNSGFFTHVKFDKPLEIKMDGKQQIAVITHDEKGE